MNGIVPEPVLDLAVVIVVVIVVVLIVVVVAAVVIVVVVLAVNKEAANGQLHSEKEMRVDINILNSYLRFVFVYATVHYFLLKCLFWNIAILQYIFRVNL